MTTESTTEAPARVQVVVVSDFVCPWCYVGLTELEKLQRDYPVDISWAPFLLDPTVPVEGRPTEPRPADAPQTPVEARAEASGLHFKRGRTYRPNSHLSLELALWAQETGGDGKALHRALYGEHFEELGNIGDLDNLVRIAEAAGLDGAEARRVLETREYREMVDEQIGLVQELGVTAVPTFIFNNEYAIVGAEQYPTFQRMMEQFGFSPPDGVEPPPSSLTLTFDKPTE